MALLWSAGGNQVLQWTVPGDDTPTTSIADISGEVSSLSWSKASQALGVATKTGSVGIYSSAGARTASFMSTHAETGASEELLCCSFAAQSLSICTGGSEQVLKLWDCGSARITQAFAGHRAAITCCTFGDRDETIASGSTSGDVLVHNVADPSSVVTVRNGRVDAERVNATQFSPFRSHVLVSGGENAVVQLWDTVKVSAALSTLRTHTGAVTSLTFSPVNELLLCSAGSDAQIVFYDINQSKSIKALKCPSPITSIDFLKDGFTVAAGAVDGKLLVYDLRTVGSNSTAHALICVESAHGGAPACAVQFAPPASRGGKVRAKASGKENSRSNHASAAPSVARSPAAVSPSGSTAGSVSERDSDMLAQMASHVRVGTLPAPPARRDSTISPRQESSRTSGADRSGHSATKPPPASVTGASAGHAGASMDTGTESSRGGGSSLQDDLERLKRQRAAMTSSRIAGVANSCMDSMRKEGALSPVCVSASTREVKRASPPIAATAIVATSHNDCVAGTSGVAMGGTGDGGNGKATSLTSTIDLAELPPPPTSARKSLALLPGAVASPSVAAATSSVHGTPRSAVHSEVGLTARFAEVAGSSRGRGSAAEERERVCEPAMGARQDGGAAREGRAAEAGGSVVEALQGLQEAMAEEVRNLHVDMLRQFHLAQAHTEGLLLEERRRGERLEAELAALRREVAELRNVH